MTQEDIARLSDSELIELGELVFDEILTRLMEVAV